MTHTIEKYGDIVNFSGVISVILPFMNLKYVGTLAPTAKILGDIPDFNVLNVPKMQPRHNPARGVYYENFDENWPCYNGTALFMGQVMKLRLSSYLVLLSTDSKTR